MLLPSEMKFLNLEKPVSLTARKLSAVAEFGTQDNPQQPSFITNSKAVFATLTRRVHHDKYFQDDRFSTYIAHKLSLINL